MTCNGILLSGDIDYSGTSFGSIAKKWAAVSGPNAVPQAGLSHISLFVGTLELYVMKNATGESEFPGEFRNVALDFGWYTFDEDTKLVKSVFSGRDSGRGSLGDWG